MSGMVDLDPNGEWGEQGEILEGLEADDQEAFNRIISELEARRHLAFPLAQWMIPSLTFAPSTAVTGAGSRRFVGVIHFQHTQKGYSFIRSKEGTEAFGMDVFLHSSQKGNFEVNDQVCFAVLLNKDGKPQAFDLNQPTEADLVRWASAEAPAQTHDLQGETQQVHDEVQATEGRHTGTISAFKPGLYGFIKCPEIFHETQTDVWVHHKQMQDFHVGDTVTFSAITNKNGQPQAVDLQAAVYGHVVPARWQDKDKMVPSQAASKPVPPKHAPKQEPKQVPPRYNYDAAAQPAVRPAAKVVTPIGARKRPAQDSSNQIDDDPNALVGTRQWGTITAWKPGGMYGFLKCDETFQAFGKDCWVHHQQIGEFNEGDAVSFTLVTNKDGHPQAIDLQSEGNKRGRYWCKGKTCDYIRVLLGLLSGCSKVC